jgi:hypothetical protein
MPLDNRLRKIDLTPKSNHPPIFLRSLVEDAVRTSPRTLIAPFVGLSPTAPEGT